MKNSRGGSASAQRIDSIGMVEAMDPDTGRLVMLPEAETVSVDVIHSLKATADGCLMTPAMYRRRGYGRDPSRDYPEPEDTRLVELVDMQAPGTAALDGPANDYWWATFMRADGVRQSMVITDLADSRDALFEHLSVEDGCILAAPFVALEVAA
jgi:hypothetical protein